MTVVVLGLVVASAAAAAIDRLALATVLVGVLVAVAALRACQLLRRLSTVADAVQLEVRTAPQLVLTEIRSQNAQSNGSAHHQEVAQRRILAVAEEARLAAADCHRELLARIDTAARGSGWHQQEQTREIEALLQLYHGFLPQAPMPPAGGWELNASGLLRLLSLIEERQPAIVLELGSGTPSTWISYALQKSGGRLVSIDHAPEAVERTRSMLSRHALDHVAEVRHAPLRTFRVGGDEFRWYALDAFTDLIEVGLLVVDGPRAAGPAARYPALHALETTLAADVTIFVGYADGPDDRNLILRWTEAFPGLIWDREAAQRHAVLRFPGRALTR